MTIKCQTCAYENPDTENYCLQCGDTLKIIPATLKTAKASNTNPPNPIFTSPNPPVRPIKAALPLTVKKSVMVQCSACGFDNDENEILCIACNTPLSKKTARVLTIELPSNTILEHQDVHTKQI